MYECVCVCMCVYVCYTFPHLQGPPSDGGNGGNGGNGEDDNSGSVTNN